MSCRRNRSIDVASPDQADAPSLPAHAPNPSPSRSEESDSAANFGSFLWNDVSILLFYRLMHEIHSTCLSVVKAPAQSRLDLLATLKSSMEVIWAVAQRHLTSEECAAAQTKYNAYASSFCAALHSCVLEVEVRDTAGLCRALLRFLEDQGFPDAEFGPLSAFLADVVMEEDVQGYSYSVRTSLAMPVPLRYDGDKRSEEAHSRKRAGYEVVLPAQHHRAEINTQVQLCEPKRRKPVLDEYRIFSLPKKAASFAADDFAVDDELLHRAYVVLQTHLDAYGSLKNLSPYARLLLWNLLDRNDALFSTLYDQHVTSEAMRQQLVKLKELVAVHKLAFEATRPAARRAAAVISWYAASAQWRDQALSKLEELDEVDWYLLGDVYRSGGKAVFPNYAQSMPVAHLALGVLRKLDKLHRNDLDGAPATHTVVEQLLLPLLQGEAPERSDFCFLHNAFQVDSPHWQRRRRKLRAIMEDTIHKTAGFSSQSSETATASSPAASRRSSTVHVFLCASLIFPLQCVGELLELCSLVMFSSVGFEAFTRSFLATNWEEEDTILSYLLRREPTNHSLVPLVGLPRLYKDLVTSIQLLVADKMLPYVVESRRFAGENARRALSERSYHYWKSLTSLFIEEDRFDDLCELRVDTRENTVCLYTTAEFERSPKVWPEDLRELQAEEENYHRGGDVAGQGADNAAPTSI
ncbi:hypothetical protein ABB37_00813 [Leptomonas pyrrhocoris]|uniref:Uncharacterized protein n=1 Tax=Leptomonas pyrrhocoris TaxID=157538 RepID=A0A0M9GBH1_LEPPY|nr:hypothetical protein ABB37_00813 [Leptomonas pyrrhocoris]XP_015665166.1 hypothetical protein ABB37_00813 [Leptomonas pyrrhocoris]KPA86726.1 hypothetical protein ABB37_00813 [Leptomonas pyrrhocoris]KPA86727.1 hypothetical protein ABB37_00813 [Leptomonas pyrrhocoris]|eukprot:XP_015665165.1 hypothetical protein ABB37_00813 [Leptomonas pyrrhocoris]